MLEQPTIALRAALAELSPLLNVCQLLVKADWEEPELT
jgi:hypothetical protein